MSWNTVREIVVRSRAAAAIASLGFLLAAGLVERAEAHLAGSIFSGGTWIHIASFDCNNELGGVPNPETKPSVFRCTVATKLVQVLCLNPNNQQVNPGQSAIRTVVTTSERILPENVIDKKKGIAKVAITFEDDPFLNPEFCVNANWKPTEALVIEMTGTMEVFECVDRKSADPCATLVKTYTETKECKLPPQYNIENRPPANTPYDCVLTNRAHVK